MCQAFLCAKRIKIDYSLYCPIQGVGEREIGQIWPLVDPLRRFWRDNLGCPFGVICLWEGWSKGQVEIVSESRAW